MKRFLIIGMCMLLITTTAGAAALDSISFDIGANTVTVSGNTGQSPNGSNITLMVLNSGEEPDMQSTNTEYCDIVSAGKDGSFSRTFEFSGATADYVFIAVDEDGTEERKTVSFYNQETLDTFAVDTASGKLSDKEIIQGLGDYGASLGVDMEFFGDSRNEGVLLKTIKEFKDDILASKALGFASVAKLAEAECKNLDKIENASTWYDAEDIIANNDEAIGVDYDDYKNHSKKSDIFSAVTGKRFAGYDELAQRLEELLDKYTSTGSGKPSSKSPGRVGGVATITSPAVVPVTPVGKFTDVGSTHWAKTAIEALSTDGIVSGRGNGSFDPDGMVTRGEIAKILALALGYTAEGASEIEFEDVNTGMWQYPYVSALVSEGIIKGVSDTVYGVDSPVSRQDLAVLLHRALLAKGIALDEENSSFSDYEDVSEYAREAVSAIAGEKIINGMPDGTFAPMSGATRAQTAKLIYEMLQKIK